MCCFRAAAWPQGWGYDVRPCHQEQVNRLGSCVYSQDTIMYCTTIVLVKKVYTCSILYNTTKILGEKAYTCSIFYPLLDTRVSFGLRTLSCPFVTIRVPFPPRILKRGGLKSSGYRLIPSIGKTKRIAFLYLFFGEQKFISTHSKFSDFF